MYAWPHSWAVMSSVVVPGHGAVVDRAFVEDQRDRVAIVAQTIRDLAAAGVTAERALAEGIDERIVDDEYANFFHFLVLEGSQQ